MYRSIAVMGIVLSCGVGAGCSVCAETLHLMVDGNPRIYLIERPNTRRPAPTVVMLHGASGRADAIAQHSNLARLAPQEGVVAVFPQSRASIWNRFTPGKESPQALEFFRQFRGPPNDVGFLKMLVADLVRRGISDPARIYLAGQSNGGFMTLSMFCLDDGMFAAIGLVVASMLEAAAEECKPAKPLPVVVMNGTADVVVPYHGGGVMPVSGQTTAFSVWSTDRLVSDFRRRNGCTQPPENTVLSGPQGQRIELERSTSCPGGPVVAYRLVGGTHQSTPATLNTGRLLLDFFGAGARAR